MPRNLFTETLQIRLATSDRKWVEKAAERAGLSVSAYLRGLVKREQAARKEAANG